MLAEVAVHLLVFLPAWLVGWLVGFGCWFWLFWGVGYGWFWLVFLLAEVAGPVDSLPPGALCREVHRMHLNSGRKSGLQLLDFEACG